MIFSALCFMKIGLASNTNIPQQTSWWWLRNNRCSSDKPGRALKMKTNNREAEESCGGTDMFSKWLTWKRDFVTVLCVNASEIRLHFSKAQRDIAKSGWCGDDDNLIEYTGWLEELRKVLSCKCYSESICRLWIWLLGCGVNLGPEMMLTLQ